MYEITSCIYNVPIFRELPEDGVRRLQQVMVHRRLRAGDVCVHAGDTVEHLIVVHRGMLRLSRIGASGREQVLRELGPGQFYGEISLFAEVICEGDLVAAAETEACVLERSAVQSVLQSAPHMTMPLVQALARRLFEAERAIGELALYDVGQRLAAELLRQAAVAAGMGGIGADVLLHGTVRFELPVSWAQLAAKLATTPESLSRRLRGFGAAGIVEVDGRHVVIRDVNKLRSLLFE